ncbi:MAG: glycosyltransferase [Fidelibacterota bacterium]
MAKLQFLISGGGTGGHLFPALAIGEELRDRTGADIHYVGSRFGIEAKILPGRSLMYTLLPIRGLQRGTSWSSFGKNLQLPGQLIRSKMKTNALMKKLQPNAVIGTGGYASALPLFVARQQNIPYFIQEQNSFPGITTKYFAESAEIVFTSFNEVENFIKKKTFFQPEIQFEKILPMGIA